MSSNFENSVNIYSSRDKIRSQIIELAKNYTSLDGHQFGKDSYLSYLIDVISILDSNLMFYASSIYREQFLSKAVQKESVLNHAYSLGYRNVYATPSKIQALVEIPFTSGYTLNKDNFYIKLFGRYDNSNLDSNLSEYGDGYDYIFKIFSDDGTVFSLDSTVTIFWTKDANLFEGGKIEVLKQQFIIENNQSIYIGDEKINAWLLDGKLQMMLDFTQVRDNIYRFTIPAVLPNEFYTKQINMGTLSNENISNIEVVSYSENGNFLEKWSYVDSLYGSDSSNLVYTYRENKYGIQIMFGNNVMGKQPKKDSQIIVIIGVTRGSNGNTIAGSVRKASSIIATNNPSYRGTLIKVINKSPSSEGLDPPTIDQIRNLALANVIANNRLVADFDYKNMNNILKDVPITNVTQILKKSDIQANLITLFGEIFYDGVIVPTRNYNIIIEDITEIDNDTTQKMFYDSALNVLKIKRNYEITINEEKYYTLFDMEINTTDLESKIFHYYINGTYPISSISDPTPLGNSVIFTPLNIEKIIPGEISILKTGDNYKVEYYINVVNQDVDEAHKLTSPTCSITYNIDGNYETIDNIIPYEYTTGDSIITFKLWDSVNNIWFNTNNFSPDLNNLTLFVKLYYVNNENTKVEILNFSSTMTIRKNISNLAYSYVEQGIEEEDLVEDATEYTTTLYPTQMNTLYNNSYGNGAFGEYTLIRKKISGGDDIKTSGLIQFDLSSLEGKEITDSTLELCFDTALSQNNAENINMYKCDQSWSVNAPDEDFSGLYFDGGSIVDGDSSWIYSGYSETEPNYWIVPGAIQNDTSKLSLNLYEYMDNESGGETPYTWPTDDNIVFNDDYSNNDLNDVVKKWYRYRNSTVNQEKYGICLKYSHATPSNDILIKFYSNNCDFYDTNLAELVTDVDTETQVYKYKPFMKVYYTRTSENDLIDHYAILECTKCANIYEKNTDGANANGKYLYLGVERNTETDEYNEIRIVMDFDELTSLPSDATIIGASIKLAISEILIDSVSLNDTEDLNSNQELFETLEQIDIYELSQYWTTSEYSNYHEIEEGGTIILDGDSSWIYSNYDTDANTSQYWIKRGGYHSSNSKSNTSFSFKTGGENKIITVNGKSGTTELKLLTDVKSWVESSENNNGWILKISDNYSGDLNLKLHSMYKVTEEGQYDTRPKLVIKYRNVYEDLGEDEFENDYTNRFTIYDIPLVKKSYYDAIVDKLAFDDFVVEKIANLDINSYKMIGDNVNLKFSNTTGIGINMAFNKKTKASVIDINPVEAPQTLNVGDRFAISNKYNFISQQLNQTENEYFIAIYLGNSLWKKEYLLNNDMFFVTNLNETKIFDGNDIVSPVYDIPIKLVVEAKKSSSNPYTDTVLTDKIKTEILNNIKYRFGYNKNIYISEIIKIIQNVRGVEYCNVLEPTHDIFFTDIYESISSDDLMNYTPELIYLDYENIFVKLF